MRGKLGDLMQQAQAMQATLKRAQEELAKLEVEGSAGFGAVTVVLSGTHKVQAVRIEPKALADRERLEKLVARALDEALRKVETAAKKKMAPLAGGLGLF